MLRAALPLVAAESFAAQRGAQAKQAYVKK